MAHVLTLCLVARVLTLCPVARVLVFTQRCHRPVARVLAFTRYRRPAVRVLAFSQRRGQEALHSHRVDDKLVQTSGLLLL